MTHKNISQFMQEASDYSLQEFMAIMGELSQESTKKGLPSHQQKELITLALALYKIVNAALISTVVRRLNWTPQIYNFAMLRNLSFLCYLRRMAAVIYGMTGLSTGKIIVVAPVSLSLWVSVTDTRSIINRGRWAAQVMTQP